MSINAEILLVHLEGVFSNISVFIGGKVSHVFCCQGKPVLPKQFSFGGKITGLATSEEFQLRIWMWEIRQKCLKSFLWAKECIFSCKSTVIIDRTTPAWRSPTTCACVVSAFFPWKIGGPTAPLVLPWGLQVLPCSPCSRPSASLAFKGMTLEKQDTGPDFVGPNFAHGSVLCGLFKKQPER